MIVVYFNQCAGTERSSKTKGYDIKKLSISVLLDSRKGRQSSPLDVRV